MILMTLVQSVWVSLKRSQVTFRLLNTSLCSTKTSKKQPYKLCLTSPLFILQSPPVMEPLVMMSCSLIS